MGHHGLADPGQGQADHSHAQLHPVDHFVQTAMESLENAGADAAGVNQLLDAGVADADQCKLGRGKKSVSRDQEQYQQDPEQHKGNHLTANSNIPKRVPSQVLLTLQWRLPPEAGLGKGLDAVASSAKKFLLCLCFHFSLWLV